MFRGKKCTDRCLNSINILKRQNAASKLENCYCDGTEDYNCQSIKDNMESLCFANEINVDEKPKKSGSFRLKIHKWLVLFVTILSIFFKGIESAIFEAFS